MNESEVILTKLMIDHKLVNQSGPILGLLPKHSEFFKNIIMIFGILINLLIMFSYTLH